MRKFSFLIFLSVILVWWSCSKKNSSGSDLQSIPELTFFAFEKDSVKFGMEQPLLLVSVSNPSGISSFNLILNFVKGEGVISSTNPAMQIDTTASGGSQFVFTCSEDSISTGFLIIPENSGEIRISGHIAVEDEKSNPKEDLLVVYKNRAPVADFIYTVVDSVYPYAIVLNAATSYDPDGQIHHYQWKVDNRLVGIDSIECMVDNLQSGLLTVGLKVTDNEGAEDSIKRVINLDNRPPEAIIEYSMKFDSYPTKLFLDGSNSRDEDGVIERFIWVVNGDSLQNEGAQPVVEIFHPGNCSVHLTVIDNQGLRDTAHVTIFVPNKKPVADFFYVMEDSTYPVRITFNASPSYDVDGTIERFQWRINGDDVQQDSIHYQIIIEEAEEIAVELIVTDNMGDSDTLSRIIEIQNKVPIAAIDYQVDQSNYPYKLHLDGSESYDPDGQIEKYIWIVKEDTLSDFNPVQIVDCSEPGKYPVTLIVFDNRGASGQEHIEIDVSNKPPIAAFDITEINQIYPRHFILDASKSSDADGTIQQYAWYLNADLVRTTVQDTVHLFIPTYGTRRLTLEVTDDIGDKDTSSIIFKPTNTLPVAEIDPNWTGIKTYYGQELEIQFTDQYVEDIDGNIVSFTWIDNGEVFREYAEQSGTFNHTISEGMHEIVLAVEDEIGIDKDTVYVELINQPVAVEIQMENGSTSGSFPLSVDVRAALIYPEELSQYQSIRWDFGDGYTFSGPNPPAHVYSKEGEFRIVLSAQAEWGDIGTDTLTIHAMNMPPIAIINPEWQNGEIEFTGPQVDLELTDQYCSDENGNIAKYEWFLDGQNVATYGPEPRGTFPLSVVGYGDHLLRLVVTDSSWDQAVDEIIIRILNQPPTLELNITPGLSGTHPFEIIVNPAISDPNGTDDIDSLIWNFGDGTPVIIHRSIQSVNHTYSEPGNYELAVKVVDKGGNNVQVSQTISVSNAEPQAYFTVSPGTVGTVPFSVEFNAGNSSDPNNDRLQFEWDFGDGETFTTDQPIVTHTFDEPGGDGNREFVVTLTVRDPYDKQKAEDQYSRTIRIRNIVPSPEILVLNNNGNASGASPLFLQLSANPYDPDQGQQHSFRWELLNENRVFIRSLGNTETISETFTTGIYYVRCYVSDGYAERYVDRRIESINYPPEVVFTSQPNRGNYPLRVAFTPQVSDPNGLDDISSCFWSFGDGNSMLAAPNERVFHVFERPGIFSVVLQVEDRAGNIESYRSEIIVSNEPPVAVLELINDGNDQYENGALAGSRLEFSAARSSDAESELSDLKFTYSWNSMIFVNEVQGQTSASYVSQNVGRFRVRLMVEDELGGRDIDELEVNCYNRAPEIQNISRTPSGNDIGTRETLLYQIQASDPDSNTPLDRLIITFEYSYSYLDLSGGGFGEVRTRTIDEIVYDGPYAGQVRINLLQPTEQVVSPIEVQATLRVYDTVEGVDGSENFNSKYDEIEDNFSYTVN